MNSRLLRLFLSVVNHRSISKASQAMHITQSALSKNMQRLEDELGVPLFERTASGTVPTVYGKALVEHATAVRSEIDRLHEHMVNLREGRTGRVTIGAGAGILELFVSRAVAAVCTKHPQIRITVVAGLVEDLKPALLSGEVDLIIGSRSTEPLEPQLRSDFLYRDTIGIIANRDNALCQQPRLHLSDLLSAPWILPPREHTYTQGCFNCFAAAGLPIPVPTIFSGSMELIDSIIADTDFITFMPVSLANTRARRKRLTQIPVPGGTWQRDVHLLQRAHGTALPAAAALEKELIRLTTQYTQTDHLGTATTPESAAKA